MMTKFFRIIFLTTILIVTVLFDYSNINSEAVFQLVNFLICCLTSMLVIILHYKKHTLKKNLFFLFEYILVFSMIYIFLEQTDLFEMFVGGWFLYMVFAILVEVFKDDKLLVYGAFSSLVIFAVIWVISTGFPTVRFIEIITILLSLDYLSLVFRINHQSTGNAIR